MKTVKAGKRKQQRAATTVKPKRRLNNDRIADDHRDESDRISEEEAEELAWMPVYRSSKASDEEG